MLVETLKVGPLRGRFTHTTFDVRIQEIGFMNILTQMMVCLFF